MGFEPMPATNIVLMLAGRDEMLAIWRELKKPTK